MNKLNGCRMARMAGRTFGGVVVLAGALAATNLQAQSYPTKQILVVSSASPGSSGDAALRMMAVKMTESMGQPVIIEMRTAARGAQQYAVVSKAAPDGHTVSFGTAGTLLIVGKT